MDPTQDPSLAIPNTPNFINPAYATPQQRQMLYQYANQLMQPQPIKSGWQGLASIANALVGGYMGHQADLAEQGGTYADQQRQQIVNQVSGANSALGSSGATSSPAGGMPVSPAPDAGGNATPDFYTTAANHESGNHNIPNSAGGSASGYYQFMPGTWQTVAQSHPELNLPGDVQHASKAQQDSAYRAFATDNAGQLDAAGIPINDKNVFMASFLGAGGAKKFFGAAGQNPNASAAAVFPSEAAANPDIFYADAAHKQPLSLAQVYQKTTGSFGAGNTTGYIPTAARGPVQVASNGPAGLLPAPSAARPSPATGQPAPASGSPVDRLAAGLIPGTDGGMGGGSVPPATVASPPLPPPRPPGLGYAPASVPPPIAAIGAALRGVPPQSPGPPPAPAGMPPPAPVGASTSTAKRHAAAARLRHEQPEHVSRRRKCSARIGAAEDLSRTSPATCRPHISTSPFGAPIFHGGARGPDIGGVAPSVLSGTPGAPVSTIASPTLATGRGGIGGAPPPQAGNLGQTILGPTSPAGSVIKQQQDNEAQGQLINAKTAANTARFQQTQEAGPALMQAQYPLRQIQGILERSNGSLPTGDKAPVLQGWASLGNMIVTAATGHGMVDEDSRLPQMDLLHKYGVVAAQNLAASLTGHPTDAQSATAASVSPGTELSGPANLHLVDNLIRLNQLAQKKAAFEHDYFLDADKRGQTPANAYDNFNQDWQKEISGPNAVPLSKYGRKVTMKSGQPGVYLPSTDPSGFSLYPANSPEFKESVMAPDAK